MRIGYLVPEFPAQTHAFFWREAMALEDLGIAVRFLSTRVPRDRTSRHAFTAEAEARTRYLTPPATAKALSWMLRHPAGLTRAIRYGLGLQGWSARIKALPLILPAADLAQLSQAEGLSHIHVHSFANAAHVAAMARLMGGARYSLTLHGDLPVYGRDHDAKLKHAAFATTVTRPLADTVAAIAPMPHVITMGVDTDRFTPAQPRENGALHVVGVARLNYVKGHVHLLRAVAALRAKGLDIRCTFAGDGPYRAEIEAEIAALGLGDHVNMTGPIGEDAVLSLLHQADVFALTSFGLGEAAPVAVMEAMACGLPVICSRIGGTGDMIADGVDGLLVPQQDEAAIANALESLCDPATRARIGMAARQTAVARFDHRACAAQLAALIRAAGQSAADTSSKAA